VSKQLMLQAKTSNSQCISNIEYENGKKT